MEISDYEYNKAMEDYSYGRISYEELVGILKQGGRQ